MIRLAGQFIRVREPEGSEQYVGAWELGRLSPDMQLAYVGTLKAVLVQRRAPDGTVYRSVAESHFWVTMQSRRIVRYGSGGLRTCEARRNKWEQATLLGTTQRMYAREAYGDGPHGPQTITFSPIPAWLQAERDALCAFAAAERWRVFP